LGRNITKKDGLVYLTKRNFSLTFLSYLDYLYFLKRKSLAPSERYLRIFVLRMYHLWSKLGNEKFINYLKVSLYAVNSFLGGKPLRNTKDQAVLVKLSNGLPAFIPAHFRRLIRENNIDFIHIVVSILYSYKGLGMDYGSPDISSIITPRFEGLSDNYLYDQFKDYAHSWARKLRLTMKDIKYYSGPELFLLSSSSNGVLRGPSTGFKNTDYLVLRTKYKDLRSSIIDFAEGIGHYRFLRKFINNADGILFPSHLHSFIPKNRKAFDDFELGRLCLKYEAAGKIRVFAIGDSWSQWVLKPLHDYIFDLLRTFPSDSTFDQDASLDSFILANKGALFWSFDLKSATDMIPKELYIDLLGGLIGPKAAKAWGSIMDRPFLLPKELLTEEGISKYGGRTVRYTRGQPMGLLSSWAALALLHHCLIAFAYHLVNPNQRVPDNYYRVLGDDIVIANKELADAYCHICDNLGIVLSIPKSYRGATIANFASQVISNKGENYSPASLKEIIQAKNLDRKAEFAYRLQRRNFIPKGINHLFRMFFVRRTWKHESSSLIRGTFTSFGRKAYRVLLQQNSYNGLTLVNYISGLTPDLSLSKIPINKIPIDDQTMSGFKDLNKFDNINDKRVHLFAYLLDKYLTKRLTEWRIKARLLRNEIAMSSLYTAMSDFAAIDAGLPRIIRENEIYGVKYHNIFAAGNSPSEFAAYIDGILTRIPLLTANLGYDEKGVFHHDKYLGDYFKFVATLPILYNPFTFNVMRKIMADTKLRERLINRGQFSLLERVLARQLMRGFLDPIPGLTSGPYGSDIKARKPKSKSVKITIVPDRTVKTKGKVFRGGKLTKTRQSGGIG